MNLVIDYKEYEYESDLLDAFLEGLEKNLQSQEYVINQEVLDKTKNELLKKIKDTGQI